MTISARYIHTNLIAHDWRALAEFYVHTFGCEPVPPERDIQGSPLEAGTGIAGVHLRGIHLRLPGYGDTGPTLEIFQYNIQETGQPTAVNRPGFAHIAFGVPDVPAAREEVLAAGGRSVGEIVTTLIAAAGSSPAARVTWCYMTDPEGNIIELQSRSVL